MSAVRFLGLDVHASKIAVAVAEPNGEARIGVFPNRLEVIRKFIAKFGPARSFARVMRPARPLMFCLGS